MASGVNLRTVDDQPISAENPLHVSSTASALPSGAATAALQTTGNTALGAPANAAWDGVAASAAMIPILKAIHAQLVIIAANTDPTP